MTRSISHKFKPVSRFGVSLHPEIFYALQVLSAEESRIHPGWKARSLEQFPRSRWPIVLPGALWTAIPDALDLAPTTDIARVLDELETVSVRQFQERILMGLFHHRRAATLMLDEGASLAEAIASLPRTKREWLSHVGLYPADDLVADVLDRLVRSPDVFRADVAKMARMFWELVFEATWAELLPFMEASVERMEALFEEIPFAEFLRHTLLPVELKESKQALRALRGGYELPLDSIEQCTFTPSAFNDSRFWTTYASGGMNAPWLPYFVPDLRPPVDRDEADRVEPAPDVALIFRALGDTTRFAIASLVGRKPVSSVELASTLSVSKPTISHHLHVLRSAGLIHETGYGGSVLISLNEDILRRLSSLTIGSLIESRQPLEIKLTRRTT